MQRTPAKLQHNFVKICDKYGWRVVEWSTLCASRRELSNFRLQKFGFDKAENEPCKVCPLSVYRPPRWIHFHQGDAGVRRLFEKISNLLEPGGIFVMEPQTWSSYKKKKKLTPQIKATVGSIKLKPELFPALLEKDYG